jgi:hypothetical protein
MVSSYALTLEPIVHQDDVTAMWTIRRSGSVPKSGVNLRPGSGVVCLSLNGLEALGR